MALLPQALRLPRKGLQKAGNHTLSGFRSRRMAGWDSSCFWHFFDATLQATVFDFISDFRSLIGLQIHLPSAAKASRLPELGKRINTKGD
jgi:hypothetical protein